MSVLDLYSRYPAVAHLPAETSAKVIAGLHSMFSMFGYPQRIISDNGSQFSSSAFADQLMAWKI